MKIGILTLPFHINYGGILQAYALQTVLERMGHEVVVLQNDLKDSNWSLFYKRMRKIVKKLFVDHRTNIFQDKMDKERIIYESQETFKFTNSYLKLYPTRKWSDILDYGIDVIVVGSDQIWRPRYCKRIENSFLDFSQKWSIKRVSYAASFGVDNWEYTKRQTKKCKQLARTFDAISVRERSGIFLCEKYLSVKASLVLDPTLLLSAFDYIKLLPTSLNVGKPNGIFTYILDRNYNTNNIIDTLSKEYGMNPVEGNLIYKEQNSRNCIIQPPVESFLKNICEAKFVVTDSFHACVFSILFEKPFIVISNPHRGIARIETLLELFDMKDRIIENEYFDRTLINRIPKAEKLDLLRKESLNFLKTALNNEK